MITRTNSTASTYGSFEISYFAGGGGNVSALTRREVDGFELRGGSGLYLVPKFITGRGQTIAWLFNTTGSEYFGAVTNTSGTFQGGNGPFNRDGQNLPQWDGGAGIVEVQMYCSTGELIGTGSVDKLGNGTRFNGFMVATAPQIKIAISSSHNMRGYIYSTPATLQTKTSTYTPEGNFGVPEGGTPII